MPQVNYLGLKSLIQNSTSEDSYSINKKGEFLAWERTKFLMSQ
jgi:hypothetical protein